MLAAVALLGATVGIVFLAAGPAAADTPEGWPEEPSIDLVEVLLVYGGIPLLVFLLISAFVLGPPLARGESLRSGHPMESHWLGGPRKDAGELAAPDSGDSQAGGAGGTW